VTVVGSGTARPFWRKIVIGVPLCQASTEIGIETFAVEVAADEDQLVGARLVTSRTVGAAVEEHMHALEYKATRVTCNAQNAFHVSTVTGVRGSAVVAASAGAAAVVAVIEYLLHYRSDSYAMRAHRRRKKRFCTSGIRSRALRRRSIGYRLSAIFTLAA
jgi:hypothetical protein